MSLTPFESADRVMIDIETLGTEPGAAILSIGAVRFNVDDGITDSFHRNISLVSCEDHGLSIDAQTLEWWLSQNEEVQHVLTDGDDLETVLTAFTTFYDDATEVWAKSPPFDCAILGHAYDVIELDTPWSFRDTRDVRTILSLPQAADKNQDGNKHDALADATHQAELVIETLRSI